MPPIQRNPRISKPLALVSLLAIIFVGVILYLNTPFINVLKDFLQSGKSEAVIASIKKEILNSGKLISEGQNESAVLTDVGVFRFTNNERVKSGLSVFKKDTELDKVAAARMRDMFANQYFEHESPTGDSASKQAERIGYEYISIGENIALGSFADDEALVLAWMNSPGHRANILHGAYTALGVAVGKGTYEGRSAWIAVQIFGKPLSDCPLIDAGLKARIDADSLSVDAYQATLQIKKSELDKMESRRGSRDEYNRAVDEYNALVQKTNALIAEIKVNVTTYNEGVQKFNACLEKTT